MQKIQVKYMFDDSGLCKQVFKEKDKNNYFIRNSVGEWLYTTKSSGFYEPSHLVENEKTFFVLDNAGRILLEDSNSVKDKELIPLLSTVLSEKSKEFSISKKLSSYEEWKSYLIQDIDKYGFTGYVDNWLHFHVFNCSEEIIDTIAYLGETFNIVAYRQKHSISDKTWILYAIKSKNGYALEELIGYKL